MDRQNALKTINFELKNLSYKIDETLRLFNTYSKKEMETEIKFIKEFIKHIDKNAVDLLQ